MGFGIKEGISAATEAVANTSLGKALGLNSDTSIPGIQPYSFYRQDSEGLSKNGIPVAVDSLFFNFPQLTKLDSYKNFNYQFVIWREENGQQTPLLTLTLPLNPQAISVSVPSTTVTTVTMRGISEEHNGAPLRQISITGSTGVYNPSPLLTPDANGTNTNGLLDYLFANTIQAAGRVIDRAQSIAEAFTSGNIPVNSPLVDSMPGDDDPAQTSYTVVHNMQRFFDLYLDAKKAGGKNSSLFLSFYMEKDQQYYDCTLNNYTIRKNPGTLEYNYSLSLTAWRRRAKKVGSQIRTSTDIQTTARSNDPNYFARVSRGLDDARGLISDSIGVLRGVDADIDRNVLQPIKKAGLLAKDLGNARKTIADYPNALAERAKSVIKSGWTKASGNKTKQEVMSRINQKTKRRGLFSGSGTGNNPVGIGGYPVHEAAEKSVNQNSASDAPSRLDEIADPVDDIFRNPDENQDILSAFSLDELELSADVQDLIEQEDEKARNITVVELEDLKENLDEFTSIYEQTLGGENSTYNRIYGLATKDTTRDLTVNDINFLSVLNEASMAIDKLIRLRRDAELDESNDYARFYADYARTEGIDFQENTSKFYVPFPFGASLESLSVQYLGSTDRWIEIAAINGLKAPYVDEEGKEVSFTASGAGNSFFVEVPDNLYIGQIVVIKSDTQKSESRKITALDVVSEIQTIVTVDGDGDLSRFRLADNATMQYFLPDTVNSNMLIAIPSSVPVNTPGNLRLNPGSGDLSNIARIAKTDIFLQYDNANQSADIAFIGSDFKLASGYHNLVQAAELKVRTRQGDLLHDPLYGNPVSIGSSVAEINAEQVLGQLVALFGDDPRFGRVLASRLRVVGGAVDTDLLIPINSTDAYLPFTTTLPRNA